MQVSVYRYCDPPRQYQMKTTDHKVTHLARVKNINGQVKTGRVGSLISNDEPSSLSATFSFVHTEWKIGNRTL